MARPSRAPPTLTGVRAAVVTVLRSAWQLERRHLQGDPGGALERSRETPEHAAAVDSFLGSVIEAADRFAAPDVALVRSGPHTVRRGDLLATRLFRDLVDEIGPPGELRAVNDVDTCVARLGKVFARHSQAVKPVDLKRAFGHLNGGIKPARAKDWAAQPPNKGPADFVAKMLDDLKLRGSYPRRVDRVLEAQAAREGVSAAGTRLPTADVEQVAAGMFPSRHALLAYVASVLGVVDRRAPAKVPAKHPGEASDLDSGDLAELVAPRKKHRPENGKWADVLEAAPPHVVEPYYTPEAFEFDAHAIPPDWQPICTLDGERLPLRGLRAQLYSKDAARVVVETSTGSIRPWEDDREDE